MCNVHPIFEENVEEEELSGISRVIVLNIMKNIIRINLMVVYAPACIIFGSN